jgi:hypothetical protein
MANPTWTCITGSVDSENWYYFEREEGTSKQECPNCGWKFRGDTYWGSSYGDTCPNCRCIAHDGDDYGDEGCFSPRD